MLHCLLKKLQYNQVLTATCIDWHIENSKNDKKVILLSNTLLFSMCHSIHVAVNT